VSGKRHFFALSPSSINLRIATERAGLSSWVAAHLSTVARSSDDSRMAVTGSAPVAGLPAPGRLPPIFFDVALFIFV
jgi:hypothetical protein